MVNTILAKRGNPVWPKGSKSRGFSRCNANHILWLNDVFDIHRNEEAIEWIRQEADGYDKGLKTLSDSLMQEKLKVEEILK